MKKITIALAFLLALVGAVIVFHQNIISSVILPQYIDWASETEAAGVKVGEPLNEAQLALAREIGIKSPEKVRLVYVDAVPFPYHNPMLKLVGEATGFIGDGIINNAQVFGYSIYVRKDYPLNTPKLAHELVHVLQIERASLKQVITQHFADLVNYGYDNSPLELEAFEANKTYSNR
ncbi:hypothetical protein [Rheinheimera baltica]|uniref:hypothetical protein n=1 Tax=Rheinheimera baltica TaxID=67576 RepID=UPI00273F8CE3|nr:hypothetical protein [Rheinheimera baltica]MDP5191447.1 hypothetical protein [Rheinheimera baltica]